MTHRAVLIALEQVYDSVLDLEQLKRVQSNLLGAARHAAEMQERGEDASEMAAQTAIALEEWCVLPAGAAELTRSQGHQVRGTLGEAVDRPAGDGTARQQVRSVRNCTAC